MEDPVIWHSGGLYHTVVNRWNQRKAYHLTSKDGMTGWVRRGVAYDPTSDFLRYSDGTVNHWHKIERPGVVIENGHVPHFLFSVIDLRKEIEKGNDTHGSKIIVVPFDGEAMDRDWAGTDAKQAELSPRVLARNAIVRELAKQYGAEINDLYPISEGHPENYTDPCHYKPEAINLQAGQVAKAVQGVLTRRQER
ncbi:MAG: hypothetical protein WCG66_04345 [bacterium]